MSITLRTENEFHGGVFKSYDVRGHFGTEITPALAGQIGRAFVEVLQARIIAVGHDMREHSPILEDSLVEGITAAGADVIRVGQCSTPMSYFAAATLDVDGAVMVTASHNPGHDNGFKFSKREGEPMGEGTGLEKVKDLVLSGKSKQINGKNKGKVRRLLCRFTNTFANTAIKSSIRSSPSKKTTLQKFIVQNARARMSRKYSSPWSSSPRTRRASAEHVAPGRQVCRSGF